MGEKRDWLELLELPDGWTELTSDAGAVTYNKLPPDWRGRVSMKTGKPEYYNARLDTITCTPTHPGEKTENGVLPNGTRIIKLRQQKNRDVRILKNHIQLFIDDTKKKVHIQSLKGHVRLLMRGLSEVYPDDLHREKIKAQLGDDAKMKELFEHIRSRGTTGLSNQTVKADQKQKNLTFSTGDRVDVWVYTKPSRDEMMKKLTNRLAAPCKVCNESGVPPWIEKVTSDTGDVFFYLENNVPKWIHQLKTNPSEMVEAKTLTIALEKRLASKERLQCNPCRGTGNVGLIRSLEILKTKLGVQGGPICDKKHTTTLKSDCEKCKKKEAASGS